MDRIDAERFNQIGEERAAPDFGLARSRVDVEAKGD